MTQGNILILPYLCHTNFIPVTLHCPLSLRGKKPLKISKNNVIILVHTVNLGLFWGSGNAFSGILESQFQSCHALSKCLCVLYIKVRSKTLFDAQTALCCSTFLFQESWVFPQVSFTSLSCPGICALIHLFICSQDISAFLLCCSGFSMVVVHLGTGPEAKYRELSNMALVIVA